MNFSTFSADLAFGHRPIRSYDERLQRRIMASHLLLKTPYVMGILEIELHTQSHAIP